MSRDQEIKELATKLHNDGVAQSFMDAVRMAESMITIDMTPSKKPISNLEYSEAKKESVPKSGISNDFSTAEAGEQIESVKVAEEIREEVTEIESEPETELEKEADELETPIMDPEARSAASIEQEIEAVESEEEPTQEELEEKETEEELEDPEFIKKEHEIESSQVTEADVMSQITEIENESEPQDEVVAEEEAEEMLEEPEVFEPETTESEVESEVKEVESEPDTINEVIDEPVSSHADTDDDDEFIVSSEDITKLF